MSEQEAIREWAVQTVLAFYSSKNSDIVGSWGIKIVIEDAEKLEEYVRGITFVQGSKKIIPNYD